jgi:hypothetical protein
MVLPLTEWLAEDRTEPEAIAACRPPVCGPGLVVSVVRVIGPEARAAEAALRQPGRLAEALSSKRASRTAAAAKPIDAGAARGFTLAMSRRDGSRPAYGAALGGRAGADLRLVLVVGEDPDAVESTVRKVAREHLGALSPGPSAFMR